MIKKVLFTTVIGFWLVFGLYLFLPTPQVPDLPDSIKSDEPGDTVQVLNLSAYYSNKSREDVVSFYDQAFHVTLAGIEIPHYRLNHPPEYAKERLRNEIQSWYFEEIVHPFRESLYISGWTPALAQLAHPWRELPVEKNGIIYFQKTTVRLMPTPLWKRLFVYTLTTVSLGAIYYVGKRALSKSL